MGSGKTTIGRLLAERMKWDFIDLDELIERRAGYSIKDIFRFYGEDTFREIETSALHATLDLKDVVIASGGGVPCFNDNMIFMKQNGMVVYLKGCPEVLAARILEDGVALRPIVKDLTVEELEEFVKNHLKERSDYYEEADYIAAIETTPESLVGQIMDQINIL